MLAVTQSDPAAGGPASLGLVMDENQPPDHGFQQPYQNANFDTYQTIWWRCENIDDNAGHLFIPKLKITRVVALGAGGKWIYTITKRFDTNSLTLPNQ